MNLAKVGVRRKITIAIAALALLGANAHATSIWCSGQVTRSLIYGNGDLMIVGSWRSDYTKLCNVSDSWLGITADTCRSWHAMVESAKARQANVTVQYVNASHTCDTLPTYSAAPKPNYFLSDD